MATIGNTYLTLADSFKRSDDEGLQKIATIIEMLNETNPILQDAPAYPCNMGTKHRTTIRTALPAPSWRILNQGTARTKSTTSQYDDTTGMLEAMSEVDERLVDLHQDKAAFRLSEAIPHIEGMNQEAADSLFFANTNTNPEEILGFAPRFDSLSQVNSSQILDAGGTGVDNTSIWFVVWGANTCHLIYPSGTTGGLRHEDKGKERVTDASSNPYYAYVDQYKWDLGLSVRDWRYIVRIANIDKSLLTTDASAGADLFVQMVDAYWQLHHRRMPGTKACVYCAPLIMQYLDHQSRNAASNVQLTWRESSTDSEPVLTFRNMPLREIDALGVDEARVV